MQIIGFTGAAGVGKDSAARVLCNQENGYVRRAFADPLKEVASVLFGVDLNIYHDPERKDKLDTFWGLTYREQLQKLGTDCVRENLAFDFWIRRMELELYKMDSKRQSKVVITDVRFDNEADFVRDMGGIIIHLTAPWESAAPEHASESGVLIEPEDYHIHNDGTLEELWESVLTIEEDRWP